MSVAAAAICTECGFYAMGRYDWQDLRYAGLDHEFDSHPDHVGDVVWVDVAHLERMIAAPPALLAPTQEEQQP